MHSLLAYERRECIEVHINLDFSVMKTSPHALHDGARVFLLCHARGYNLQVAGKMMQLYACEL